MVWCIIVGCNNKQKKLDTTPEGFNDPPNSIVCVECGNNTSAVYRRDDFYFSICCINCCRISKGVPFLSCGFCHASFGDYGTSVCHGCSTAFPSQFLHCPHCGRKTDI